MPNVTKAPRARKPATVAPMLDTADNAAALAILAQAQADAAAAQADADAAAAAAQADADAAAAAAAATGADADQPATAEPSRGERIARARLICARLIKQFHPDAGNSPFKPVGGSTKPADLTPRDGNGPTDRTAATLAILCLAHGVRVPVSADAAPVTLARLVNLPDPDQPETLLSAFLENGAGRRILGNFPGITYQHGGDGIGSLTLTAKTGAAIASRLGSLLPPDQRA